MFFPLLKLPNKCKSNRVNVFHIIMKALTNRPTVTFSYFIVLALCRIDFSEKNTNSLLDLSTSCQGHPSLNH